MVTGVNTTTTLAKNSALRRCARAQW